MAWRRLFLCVALLVGWSPILWTGAAPPAPFQAKTYRGKVVPLADVLKPQGVRLDPDAAPTWLALVTDDGKVYPLIKDDGGRLFFKDAKLLHRPMQLTGRVLPESNLLQVVQVHSVLDGRLHEVFYWCDVCSIRRGEMMICECCGAPMYRREEPVGR